jgi:hypothetical protein
VVVQPGKRPAMNVTAINLFFMVYFLSVVPLAGQLSWLV